MKRLLTPINVNPVHSRIYEYIPHDTHTPANNLFMSNFNDLCSAVTIMLYKMYKGDN